MATQVITSGEGSNPAMFSLVHEAEAFENPQTFLEVVAAGEEDLAESVCTLLRAARELWVEDLEGEALVAAMHEVDLKTQGQPYRLETEIGPLFAVRALWLAAGRSGCGQSWDRETFTLYDAGGPAALKQRPTWDGDWRPKARTA